MTIIEAGAHLYKWFYENDCYRPEKDFTKLILISENKDEDKAAIECALDSLEEALIIKKKTLNDKDYWVLNRKFTSLEQSVSISPTAALNIYQQVKMYTEAMEDSEYECDVMNINEKDINILLDTVRIISANK